MHAAGRGSPFPRGTYVSNIVFRGSERQPSHVNKMTATMEPRPCISSSIAMSSHAYWKTQTKKTHTPLRSWKAKSHHYSFSESTQLYQWMHGVYTSHVSTQTITRSPPKQSIYLFLQFPNPLPFLKGLLYQTAEWSYHLRPGNIVSCNSRNRKTFADKLLISITSPIPHSVVIAVVSVAIVIIATIIIKATISCAMERRRGAITLLPRIHRAMHTQHSILWSLGTQHFANSLCRLPNLDFWTRAKAHFFLRNTHGNMQMERSDSNENSSLIINVHLKH